jgi:hypothetical protein
MHEQGAAEPSDAHATYVPYEYPGEYEAGTVEDGCGCMRVTGEGPQPRETELVHSPPCP